NFDKFKLRLMLFICQNSMNGEIWLFSKFLNLPFPLNEQTQRHTLHSTSGQTPTDFFPQNRRKLIAYQSIQNASCSLRADQIFINFPWILQRFLDRAFSNFMKNDSFELTFCHMRITEYFLNIRRNCLTFPVRVG